MVLVRVRAEGESRAEVLRVCRYFPLPGGGRQPHHLYPGDHRQPRQDQAVLEILKDHGILEVVRTGALAIQRSKKD